MEIKIAAEGPGNGNEQDVPLLGDVPKEFIEEKTLIQRAIRKTFQSTAYLANLLPTGTVLAFQLLSPILSNQGHCDIVSRYMTATLVGLCALSCFLQSFTDSFKDQDGDVCYGFATLHGLWVLDGSTSLPQPLASKYRLHFMDFMHAFMSILVFAAIALFNDNVVNCLYPSPSKATQEVLTGLPISIGVFCSMFFVAFPTKRLGIGFPLSSDKDIARA